MIITPKLGLAAKSFSEFDTYSADIVDALTGNINFPITEPAIAMVTAKQLQYHTAMLAAIGGNSQQRQTRNQFRDEMHIMLTNLANDVASRSNNDLAIYMTSGFDYRRPPVPSGDPVAPQNFRIVYNEHEGELVCRCNKAANAVMYEIWMGTTSTPPASGGSNPTPGPIPGGWVKVSESTSTSATITGLVSGTRYYAHVIAKGRRNKSSSPSNTATKICP